MVIIALCRDEECPYKSDGEHVRIERTYTRLERGAATAISYAWGAFNREER